MKRKHPKVIRAERAEKNKRNIRIEDYMFTTLALEISDEIDKNIINAIKHRNGVITEPPIGVIKTVEIEL